MPGGATKFKEDWLDLTDKNGTKISDWCIKGRDEYTAYCVFCRSTVNIDNSGKIQLLQHSSTIKHKSANDSRKDPSQTKLVSIIGNKGICLNVKPSSSSDSKQVQWIANKEDKASKAEILWIIHLALNNYSFSSCESVKCLFTEMFPDSSLPQGIQLSSTKVSYAISHGLGPYFLKQVTDELSKDCPFYTIMFDETLNDKNLKQLDVYIRYWSSKENCILERYIGSELMGHAAALDISAKIKSVLKFCNIDLKYMLMLGSDGPNVNKAVFKLFDNEVKLIRNFGLINIGTCNLHIIHNAFGNGLKIESFVNIIDFLENIHFWFVKFPSRQEDLQKILDSFGDENLKILKFVSNRWLSLVKVCDRILNLMESIKIYFLNDLPKDKSRLIKSDRYTAIVKVLENPLTPVYLHFMISVGSLFEQFLKLLQEKRTLIHVLYDELTKLLLQLMGRFIDENVLADKSGEDLVHINLKKESVSAKQIDVGNCAKKYLSSLSSEMKADFLADAKEFFILITSYLQEKLPLKNKCLQSLQILHPIVRKEPIKSSLSSVKRLANILPMVISENEVDKLADEWRFYINDKEICNDDFTSIDNYWNCVFNLVTSTNSPRYPFLTKLVKSVLTFSHGQASVERGFSINKRMLSSERASMNLDTIRGLRMIKDAVQEKATNVTVTQEMIKFYREAYSKYHAQKLAEKKQTESQGNVQSQVRKVKDPILAFKEDISSAQSMIDEGTTRLQAGVKRKCMKEIEAAQALIDAGNKRLKTANDSIKSKKIH